MLVLRRAEDQTQGFVPAGQALDQLSYAANLV